MRKRCEWCDKATVFFWKEDLCGCDGSRAAKVVTDRIVADLRALAELSDRHLATCLAERSGPANSYNRTVHAAQSLAYHSAADRYEQGKYL